MRHAKVCLAILLLGASWGCTKQTGTDYGSTAPPTAAPTPGGGGATGDLAALKTKLATEGKYACCIKSPCDFCARSKGSCDCSIDLKAGRSVCGECYKAWQAGNGNVAGVDPATVKGPGGP